MKRLLILITTLASLTVQGQSTNSTQKILIGFNFSPDYSSRTLKNNNQSTAGVLVINSRNNIEVPKFGYTIGVNTCFQFTQLLSFETGIQFSNKGYKTKTQDFNFIPPDPSLPTKGKTVYAYQYVGIPLKMKFSFGKSKVQFVSSTGIMTNFLMNVRQTSNYEYSNGKTEKKSQSYKSGFNTIDISPIISFGIDYKLNTKTHLFAEPTFRYGVIKTKNAPIKENLWNAGLNVGFYHAFK